MWLRVLKEGSQEEEEEEEKKEKIEVEIKGGIEAEEFSSQSTTHIATSTKQGHCLAFHFFLKVTINEQKE